MKPPEVRREVYLVPRRTAVNQTPLRFAFSSGLQPYRLQLRWFVSLSNARISIRCGKITPSGTAPAQHTTRKPLAKAPSRYPRPPTHDHKSLVRCLVFGCPPSCLAASFAADCHPDSLCRVPERRLKHCRARGHNFIRPRRDCRVSGSIRIPRLCAADCLEEVCARPSPTDRWPANCLLRSSSSSKESKFVCCSGVAAENLRRSEHLLTLACNRADLSVRLLSSTQT